MQSIHKTETELKVLEIINQILQNGPYRVVDLDCRVAGKSLLRIFIEKVETGTASIGDCVEVSRLIDPAIETAQLFSGPFELEVSSPGIERRLRLVGDFERVVGTEVKLELMEKVEGLGANLRGVLVGIEDEKVSLKMQGKQVLVGLGNIKKAQRVFLEVNAR